MQRMESPTRRLFTSRDPLDMSTTRDDPEQCGVDTGVGYQRGRSCVGCRRGRPDLSNHTGTSPANGLAFVAKVAESNADTADVMYVPAAVPSFAAPTEAGSTPAHEPAAMTAANAAALAFG